ncbi:uncharacterized protein LOC131646741 [Vicia villosa]|uniref:uncharacterized protein LOC131646741 n=1 Tax=Vicia villosa TaxID=3911 RepID=UPI00273B6AF0|nr:uncharacterized protein LOC131646741 [Vicia villosa]
MKVIEKILHVKNCTDAQKVQFMQFGTHMLEKEAEDWCVTLFREDVRGKKEVKSLELKQSNGTVAEYAARFRELIKYCPHYNNANAERFKCFKFVNGLRPEIKKAIGYQQIMRFIELVNKSIYDEDCRESAAHYKSMNDKKVKDQFRGKSYADKGKRKVSFDRKPSGGGAPTPIRCYSCGVEGHRAYECTGAEVKCFKCGKVGNKANDCRGGASLTCYNCGEQGNISTKCDKLKKEQAKEKVFSLSGSETAIEDRLIRGTCFINGTLLIDIIDTGAIHSIISLDCFKRLNLVLSDIRESMIIDTTATGSVTTSYVCLNCPLRIFGRDFEIDLVCLSLDQLDVILGMN